MFSDGHCQKSSLHAGKCRLVGSGDDDHGFCATSFIEIAFQKFADFPAPLTDEGDHVHVRLGFAGHHPHQSGFAHAAAGEDAKALAAAKRSKCVDGFDAGFKRLIDAAALEWVRCLEVQLGEWLLRDVTQIIERLAHAIDHPAQEYLAHRHAERMPGGDYFAARANALRIAKRHQEQIAIAKADHFGQ